MGTVSKPLNCLQEILAWTGHGDVLCQSAVSLDECYAINRSSSLRPKLLLCHDMKGGYQNDRFVEGSNSLDFYRFSHWWRVDYFVYFSHHLITIPPPCWIDAAHRHGVPVLGTFITESQTDEQLDGQRICSEIFSSTEVWKVVADKLVAIAAFYCFDGWLINIENIVESVHVKNVLEFVRYLTEKLKSIEKHSTVIWYDSITTDGELKWQDELNALNKPFFDACNGVFLNYCWTKEKLLSSYSVATDSRHYDVFVGCDVFGRGCFGNGGFNTNMAVAVASECRLSTAMFAPAWTLETFPQNDFEKNNSLFWEYLEDHVPHRKVLSLPVRSSFCQGWGKRHYRDGQVVMEGTWTSLSLQQLQPTEFCSTDEQSDCDIKYITSDGFMGGGCLQISLSDALRSYAIIKLFDTCIEMEEDELCVSYTCKENEKIAMCLCIGVCSDPYDVINHLLCDLTVNDESLLSLSQHNISIRKILRPFRVKEFINCEHGQWITREYCIRGIKGKTLQHVSAALLSDPSVTYQHCLLGQLQMVGMEKLAEEINEYEKMKKELNESTITAEISVSVSEHLVSQQSTTEHHITSSADQTITHSTTNLTSVLPASTIASASATTAAISGTAAAPVSLATTSAVTPLDSPAVTPVYKGDLTVPDATESFHCAAAHSSNQTPDASDGYLALVAHPRRNHKQYNLVWKLPSLITNVNCYYVYMRNLLHTGDSNWKLLAITPRSCISSLRFEEPFHIKDIEFAVEVLAKSGFILPTCVLHVK